MFREYHEKQNRFSYKLTLISCPHTNKFLYNLHNVSTLHFNCSIRLNANIVAKRATGGLDTLRIDKLLASIESRYIPVLD